MKVLLTGFDPFGKEKINPAWEAVQRVQDKIGDVEVVKLQVPTVFWKCSEIVLAKAREVNPDVILCVGQAGGREGITVERVGINLVDAGIVDNEGQRPVDVPVVENGENAYFSTVPVKAMVEHMQEAGLKAGVSYTAGTYVCNALLYSVLYALQDTDIRAGFIHVPYLPEQVEGKQVPYMTLEDMVKGLEICVETACTVCIDSHTSFGKEM